MYDIKSFQDIFILVVAQELLHLITLGQFMIEYCSTYRAQLFGSRGNAGGDIYDFDPDQHIVAPSLPNGASYQGNKFDPEDLLEKMVQFEITKDMLIKNLKPKKQIQKEEIKVDSIQIELR